MILHASLIAAYTGASGWRGVLLTGPSGAGKSDLALRCMEAGWRLVADDRVVVWAAGGRAFGKAPDALSGLLELRGQGFGRFQPVPWAEISAAVALQGPEERQPAPAFEPVAGVALPRFSVAPFEASAPARLRRIVGGLAREL